MNYGTLGFSGGPEVLVIGYPTVINYFNVNFWPLNLIDGVESTYWAPSTNLNGSPWMKLNLREPRTITRVRYKQAGGGSQGASSYKLEYSNDDVTYYLAHRNNASNAFLEESIPIPRIKAQYWKMTALGSGSGLWAVYAFELYSTEIP